MPEFEQESAEAYRTVFVHLVDEQAERDFQERLGITLTKAKHTWFPPVPNESYAQKAFVSDEP